MLALALQLYVTHYSRNFRSTDKIKINRNTEMTKSLTRMIAVLEVMA